VSGQAAHLTNAFINGYRAGGTHPVRQRCPEDAVAAFYGDAPVRARDPEAAMLEGALGDEVTRALATLAPDYRQVVELADLRGIRYRDIADQLGLPIGTVMSRLFRARRQLELQLTDYAAEDYGIRKAA
jgi:RNA polymerase sigma-70 factor (ECF subfamily)